MNADWSSARRVLAVRLDAVGDVLMTTPALAALRHAAPGRRLTLLTSSAGAAAAPLLSMVDDVIAFDPPWMKPARCSAGSAPDQALIARLRLGRFEAAAIFTVYSQSALPAALLCFLAEIPLRLAHACENPYQLLTNWIPESEPQQGVRHEVQRQLDLVASVGAALDDVRLAVRVSRRAVTNMRRRLKLQGLDAGQPWIVVHPGASAPSRRYPAESFVAAARVLTAEHGWRLVFTGDRSERGLVESIRSAIRGRTWSLAGQTNLEELAAVLSQAALLISNNTGPVHLAAAVGTPVVDLYAQTNLQHTPWEVPHVLLYHEVPCRNCYKSICPEQHHDCLRRVPPEAVVTAALRLARVARRQSGHTPGLVASTALAPA